MRAVWIAATAALRSRWRSWAALALIIGVLGGLVIAAAAAARRTSAVYPEFIRAQRAYQQFMFPVGFYPGSASISAEELRALPEVEAVVEGLLFDGTPSVTLRGSLDPRLDRSLNRVRLVEGRLPTAADEVLLPIMLARARGLHVGDTLPLTLKGWEGPGPAVDLRVVGVGVAPGEFPPFNDIGVQHWAHVGPAFVERYADLGGPFVYVFLRDGEGDLPVFLSNLQRLANGGFVIGYQQASLTKNVQRAFQLQAASVWLFALILGATALAIAAQSLSRATWREAQDHPVLSSVGMSRRQLFGAGIVRAGVIAFPAAVVAVGLAWSLQPLAPTGLARLADLRPGFRFDGTAFGFGALAVVVSILALSLAPSWRSARVLARGVEPAPGARVSEAAAHAGMPATAGVGLHFAFERGRGALAVPTRATVVGVALAIGAIAMTLTFGGSLDHLLRTPRLYGVKFDLVASTQAYVPRERVPALLESITALPEVEAVAEGAVGLPVRVNGVLADGLAVDTADASWLPPVVEGRAPRTDGEVLLGVNTLRATRARIGGTVELGVLGRPPRPFKVVGAGIVPTVGHSANLGEGTVVTLGGVKGILGVHESLGQVLIRLRPGADPDAARAAVTRASGGVLDSVSRPLQPGDLVSFGGHRDLPFVLAGLLALMAAVTVVHALLASIARRRRDLAVLKTFGFTAAQARATVRWQASGLMIAGLGVGIPAGIGAGRALWTLYAHRLGVLAEPRTPVLVVLLIVPAALLLGNFLALGPGGRAARVQPAVTLRAE